MKLLAFSAIFFLIMVNIAYADANVTIYKNEACGHCNIYLTSLKNYLYDMGIDNIEEKLMINNLTVRTEVEAMNKRLGVPPELQGHMITVVNDLVLEGHVPLDMLKEFFSQYPKFDFPKMVVYQDSMAEREQLISYKLMDNNGIRQCAISTSIKNCVTQKGMDSTLLQSPMLPLVLISGLVDGINPCAFAVLLFFIAFLLTIRRGRADVIKVGLTYIVAIYLTYLGIGIGLLRAIAISGQPHFMAQIGAYLTIALGIINIKDYFWYGKWFSLRIPHPAKATIRNYVHKATLPAAAILGVLVALCEFPCTGGIYIAILGILAIKTTFLEGLTYLLVYNIMFVAPLLIVLLMATNRRIVGKMEKWQKAEREKMKLLAGIVMMALGIIVLLWFV